MRTVGWEVGESLSAPSLQRSSAQGSSGTLELPRVPMNSVEKLRHRATPCACGRAECPDPRKSLGAQPREGGSEVTSAPVLGTVAAPPEGSLEGASDRWALAEMKRCYHGLCSSPGAPRRALAWASSHFPGWSRVAGHRESKCRSGAGSAAVGTGAETALPRRLRPGKPAQTPSASTQALRVVFEPLPSPSKSNFGIFEAISDGSAIKAGSFPLPSVLIALLLQWHCGNMSR